MTLEVEKTVPITKEDLKKADVSAYTEWTGQRVYLDDVYNVTGYSGNAETSDDTPQVRMEGTFKVSDLNPVPDWYNEDQANNWNYENTGRTIKQMRLERPIHYTVAVTKPVDFTMTYTDPVTGQTYVVLKDGDNPFTVNVEVTLSSSFTYWDEDNTCPGLGLWTYGRDRWHNGEIRSNDNAGIHSGDGVALDAGPGMDFSLGAPMDDTRHDIVAVEVQKYVQGIFGEGENTEIHTLNLAEETDCRIDVYQNSNTPLHEKTLTVGTDGMGLFFDYDVTAGTYNNPAHAKIAEDPDSVADELRDANGRKWTYHHSSVETEFAWRNDGNQNPERYVSQDYTKEDSSFESASEVLGEYLVSNGQPYTYQGEYHDGIHEFNRFLEFYVFNIYEPKQYPVFIKKVDAVNPDTAGGIAGAEFDLYGPYTSDETTAAGFNAQQSDKKINSESIISSATNTKIGDLSDGIYYLYETKAPTGYKLMSSPVVITVDSTKDDAQAVSYSQTGNALSGTGLYVTKDGNDQDLDEPYHQISVTNEPVDIEVEKEWSDGQTVSHTADQVSYRLYRQPYTANLEFDPEEITTATGFTGFLQNSNHWKETITGLPQTGTYTPAGGEPVTVSYQYYVSEDFEGYKSETEGSLSQDGNTYKFTVTNTPHSSFDSPTELDIAKEWRNEKDVLEQNAHPDDSITFHVTQKKYRARGTFPVSGGGTVSSNVYPVRINLIDGNGEKSEYSTVVYVPSGKGLNITPSSNSSGKVNGNGFAYNGSYNSNHTFTITGVTTSKEVTLKLLNHDDKWGKSKGTTTWIFSADNSLHQVYQEDDLLEHLNLIGDPVSMNEFDYSLILNEEKNNSIVTPLQNAQGEGIGTGVWSGQISNLPFFEKDGNNYYVYVYDITEVKIGTDDVHTTTEAGYNGETSKYFVKWIKNTDGSWTITNKKKPGIDIEVKKVDVSDVGVQDAETLKGATFRLEKYTDSNYSTKDTSWEEQTKADSNNTGLFSFDLLTEGYYLLVETKCPAGYVKTGADPRFRVKNEGGILSVVLVDENGQDITNEDSETIKISNASSKTTVIVGNEPGQALPSAGGPGVWMFFGIGGVLVLGGLVLLISRIRVRARE